MSVQTYCLQADVEAILSAAGVTAFVDDDESGAASAGETAYATSAIERAAVDVNAILEVRYKLVDLASNAWAKWCNATLAAYYIATRRGNAAPPELAIQAERFRDALADIANLRQTVPQQNESFDYLPAVSNFSVVRGVGRNPVRVSVSESTGTAPDQSRKRNVGGWPYYW